jgi:hypothetical protein
MLKGPQQLFFCRAVLSLPIMISFPNNGTRRLLLISVGTRFTALIGMLAGYIISLNGGNKKPLLRFWDRLRKMQTVGS